ncbi:MAG: hypothetical protein AAFX54_13860 [Pseudomonadota bacterium]
MSDLEKVLQSLKANDPAASIIGGASDLKNPAIGEDVNSLTNFQKSNKGLASDTEPEIVEEFGIQSLRWYCAANQVHNLYVNGRPFTARGISYSTSIHWRAGGGWPIYRTGCPRSVIAGSQFLVPRAYEHCVLVAVGGIIAMACRSPARSSGSTPTNVQVAVNDGRSRYGDNSGGFWLYIHHWW